MNKKEFVSPTIDIIDINSEDIIKTSGLGYWWGCDPLTGEPGGEE